MRRSRGRSTSSSSSRRVVAARVVWRQRARCGLTEGASRGTSSLRRRADSRSPRAGSLGAARCGGGAPASVGRATRARRGGWLTPAASARDRRERAGGVARGRRLARAARGALAEMARARGSTRLRGGDERGGLGQLRAVGSRSCGAAARRLASAAAGTPGGQRRAERGALARERWRCARQHAAGSRGCRCADRTAHGARRAAHRAELDELGTICCTCSRGRPVTAHDLADARAPIDAREHEAVERRQRQRAHVDVPGRSSGTRVTRSRSWTPRERAAPRSRCHARSRVEASAQPLTAAVGASVRALASQQLEQRFLRVQAVLGLVPDPRPRAVDDVGGHLFAAMGRQAVQEDCARPRRAASRRASP